MSDRFGKYYIYEDGISRQEFSRTPWLDDEDEAPESGDSDGDGPIVIDGDDDDE